MQKRSTIIFLAIVVGISLTGCIVTPRPSQPWTYENLRGLDAVDARQPFLDLIAIYTRMAATDFQIRLDLLDIQIVPDYDLYILLDTRPGGKLEVYLDAMPLEVTSESISVKTVLAWDILLVIPASGSPRAYQSTEPSPSTNLIPRLARDPWLDMITISLSRYHFSTNNNPIAVQAFITNPGDHVPADQIGPVRTDGQPPASAPLLLAFWDSYTVYSPAMALRRWDGAHTGPTGERHGLQHLIEAAERYDVPIALLDLKTPMSLAALVYSGKMEQIYRLTSRGLLILPDYAYGEPAEASLGYSRGIIKAFGLPTSQFAYGSFANLPRSYRALFTRLADSSHLARSGSTRLIPLPSADTFQATPEGVSLEVRSALLETAISPDLSDLIVLGGSLPRSTWGDADMVTASFAYIAAHPWIEPQSLDSLLTFPTREQPLPQPLTSADYRYYEELSNAPDNIITDLAWHTFFSLTAPTENESLHALRSIYFGQIGILLSASHWAEQPFELSDCSIDFDADGEDECLLASTTFFAMIEKAGARLTHLFYCDENGPHQLIGPSTQFWVGISDPSLWDLAAGEAADPSQIMGAFSDTEDTFQNYASSFHPGGSLTLVNSDGTRTKTYFLTESGLTVVYHTTIPVTTRIPLVVDPQAFLFNGRKYQAALGPKSWRWGPETGLKVDVEAAGPITAQGFTASYPFLSLPEDPDLDYPTGHYLPFPLSVVEVRIVNDLSIEITIRD